MTAAACPRDGGALLLQAVDQRIGLTRRLAACFVDHRNPRRCEHSLQRLFGLALGYEDLCDHDRGHPLAGSSTPNRLELGTPEQAPQDRYKRIVADPQRLDALLVELFLDSHAAAPEEIVLDVDATDDPLHGRQEGRFFHGYYDCYCYLPLYVTAGHTCCAGGCDGPTGTRRTGPWKSCSGSWGRSGSAGRGCGWWCGGDAGFCRDELMAWCEAAEGVDYVFGLAQNARLKRARIRTQPQYEQMYRARGDMQNRIKEQQLDLFADRTSAATLRANQLRLYWALFAHSLARLRAETPG